MGNAPSEYTDHTWHALTAQDALKVQRSSASGLSQDEAQRRLQQHGANRLPPPQRRGPLLRLLYQFHNVLLYLMLVAAIITALLGHWVDTSVILAAVLINVIIGFIQEGKAENALDAIRSMLSPHAMVL
ncbi:MAG: carbonate dehydratase, partial [Ectopseudomonas oleovorans]